MALPNERNGKERQYQRRVRWIVTGVLLILFGLMVVADICDSLWGHNLYDIPAPVYGLVAILIGAVFGVQEVSEWLKPKG